MIERPASTLDGEQTSAPPVPAHLFAALMTRRRELLQPLVLKSTNDRLAPEEVLALVETVGDLIDALHERDTEINKLRGTLRAVGLNARGIARQCTEIDDRHARRNGGSIG